MSSSLKAIPSLCLLQGDPAAGGWHSALAGSVRTRLAGGIPGHCLGIQLLGRDLHLVVLQRNRSVKLILLEGELPLLVCADGRVTAVEQGAGRDRSTVRGWQA